MSFSSESCEIIIYANTSSCCCDVKDILNRVLKVLLVKVVFCNMLVDIRVMAAQLISS